MLTLLVFGMSDCHVCHDFIPRVARIRDQVAGDRAGRGQPAPKVLLIDCGKNGDMADRYGVDKIPSTFLVRPDGSPVWAARGTELTDDWLRWLCWQT